MSRLFDGEIKDGGFLKFMHSGADTHKWKKWASLSAGQLKQNGKSCIDGIVGYVIAGIKTISDIRVGDTVTHPGEPW
jgi:GTP-binding protein LepA